MSRADWQTFFGAQAGNELGQLTRPDLIVSMFLTRSDQLQAAGTQKCLSAYRYKHNFS